MPTVSTLWRATRKKDEKKDNCFNFMASNEEERRKECQLFQLYGEQRGRKTRRRPTVSTLWRATRKKDEKKANWLSSKRENAEGEGGNGKRLNSAAGERGGGRRKPRSIIQTDSNRLNGEETKSWESEFP